jgi:hypothetical protein
MQAILFVFSHGSQNPSIIEYKEEADLLQKGEIGFQMYARFRMGFIGWPNLPM